MRLIAAFAAVALTTQLHAAEIREWPGTPAAPALELLTVDGAPLSLAQLRGKVVLVNFWATWCEPCITEMPSLQRLRDELGPRGFEVLAVNYQEGPVRINEFIRKMKLSLPMVRDTDGSVAKQWGARVFPASFLIDRDGKIRYAVSGDADWTSPGTLRTIEPLLAAAPARSAAN